MKDKIFKYMSDEDYIIKTLKLNGYQAYYIGGCVRDYLLNKKSQDKDIVTSARPERIAEIFSSRKVENVGKSFGVTIVDGIEISTFRKDRYFGLDDKNVIIKYSNSLKEDTDRRDFTINAIAMELGGIVHDYHGGVRDLKNKIIKFIGNPNNRIYEDPNRIIRAARFAALIDGTFHRGTLNALIYNKDLVKNNIAKERIQKELIKALKTVRNTSKFFKICHNIGILEYIFPSLEKCIGVSQNKFHQEELFNHNMIVGDQITCNLPLIKLAGYLHDVGKVDTKEYNEDKKDYTFYSHQTIGEDIVKKELKDLKFSNNDIHIVSKHVRLHMRSGVSNIKSSRKILRVLSENNLDYRNFIRIKIADKKGKLPSVPLTFGEIRKILNNFKTIINRKEPFNLKNLAINGNDVMEVLKIKQGVRVGEVLNLIFEKVIDNPQLNYRKVLLEMLEEYHSPDPVHRYLLLPEKF